ncbi:MAG: ATP-dependent DNA ligase [Methanoregulaceae archaeon]
MLFLEFARICDRLEAIPGRLEMIDLISRTLPALSDEELPVFVRFVMGRVFPDWSSQKLGIGPNLLYEAVAYVVGSRRESVVRQINRAGDVGKAVEELLAGKEQTSFFTEELDLVSVYHSLESVADTEGKKSQREKLAGVKRLFGNSSALEGRYLARLLLEELRIGVGEGSVRDAVAKAFGVENALVEHAFQANNDLGAVALLAKKGPEALREVRIEPFRPVRMMLAQQGSIKDMTEEHGQVAAEFKYDGSRFQFHRRGNRMRMYSRRLEEVTDALPDVLKILEAVTSHDVILDGEVIAIRDGRPMPFQTVLRRVRRKHAVTEMAEEIGMVPRIFDILYLDGTTLIDLPFTQRRKILESVVSRHVTDQLVSEDIAEIEGYYQKALNAGHEGIMLKVLSSQYTPGVRGKNWVKIKPEADTLDLAVIGAEWGEGKRAHVFGSFLLACQSNGKLVPVSRVATGFSDEQLAEVYELLKDTVISEQGKEVRFEPTLVLEVGYAEIQKSPNYEGGFALRFPRFIRLRDDKDIGEIDSAAGLRLRYERQSALKGNG